MFWPRGGDVLHVYSRQMDLGSGLNSVRVFLNNMADWDDQTELLCADG